MTSKYADLSKADYRISMLIRLNFNNYEIAQILGISENSVRKTILRLRKKLNIDSPEELIKLIQEIEPEENV